MNTQIFSRYILLFTILLIGNSCSSTGNLDTQERPNSSIVAVIDQTDIHYDELLKGFSQNANDSIVTSDQLREFLPKYVEYKVKLNEGKQHGYNTNPDLLDEYDLFARQAAKSYWLENDLKTSRIDTFIQRSQYELKAFHILIEADQTVTNDEEISIRNRLLDAKNALLSGANPEDVNLEYSSKRDGQPMGGELPWVTALRTVAPFEQALFLLQPGEISNPVRTQFGYHIIMLKDKRKRSSDRKTSHLFIAGREDDSHLEYIRAAHDSLAAGMNWEYVVEQFTEDRRTLSSGGDINWVGYGMQYPEDFVDEVMKMDATLPYSEPIVMDYGAHIIRVDSVRTFDNNEKLQAFAKEELRRTGRLVPGDEDINDQLKRIGGFTIHKESLNKTVQSLSQETIDDNFELNTVLFTFNNKSYTTGEFISFLEQTHTELAESNDINYYTDFSSFTDQIVDSSLVDLTEKTFPDYRDQMSSFKNDLIVFKVNENLLWNIDEAEESMLRSHYEQYSEKYKTNRTYTYSRFGSASDSLLTEVIERIKTGASSELIAEEYDKINVITAAVSNSSSELFSTFSMMDIGELTPIETTGNWYYFYILTHIEPVRQLTFTEARESVFNDIQLEHEKMVMDSLKEKYSIQLFPGHIQ